jgi:hypothetical protein
MAVWGSLLNYLLNIIIMALNLNKSGDDNSKPNLEKKGLNLKKTGDDSKVKLDLSKDKNNETTTSQVTSDTADKKGSSKGLVIAAVLAVALGAFWFFNRDTTNIVDGEPGTTTVVSPDDSTAVEDGATTAKPIDSINDVPGETVSNTDNGKATDPSVSSKSSDVSSTPATSEVVSGKPTSGGKVSDSPVKEGSVEDKARQVIDGVYGNGTDRKNALGEEYRSIQSKVNELYRRGLN